MWVCPGIALVLQLKVLKLLAREGSTIDLADNAGVTPLFCAACESSSMMPAAQTLPAGDTTMLAMAPIVVTILGPVLSTDAGFAKGVGDEDMIVVLAETRSF